MFYPFNFVTLSLRKMRFAFFAAAFLLLAPKLQPVQQTNGQCAISETVVRRLIVGEGVDPVATFVLELPTAAKPQAATTVGAEST